MNRHLRLITYMGALDENEITQINRKLREAEDEFDRVEWIESKPGDVAKQVRVSGS
jgi:hypothetical protein